eukprot:1111202-Prymnesium_polylepis.2
MEVAAMELEERGTGVGLAEVGLAEGNWAAIELDRSVLFESASTTGLPVSVPSTIANAARDVGADDVTDASYIAERPDSTREPTSCAVVLPIGSKVYVLKIVINKLCVFKRREVVVVV